MTLSWAKLRRWFRRSFESNATRRLPPPPAAPVRPVRRKARHTQRMRACNALQHVVAPCCSTLLQHVALFYGSTLHVDVRLPRPHIAGNMGVHVRRVARVRAVSCQASDDVARARTETAAGTGPQEGRERSGRRLALMLSRSGFRSPVGTGRWVPHVWTGQGGDVHAPRRPHQHVSLNEYAVRWPNEPLLPRFPSVACARKGCDGSARHRHTSVASTLYTQKYLARVAGSE